MEERIRIHHGCEGGIEKSVPMITDWHYKACYERDFMMSLSDNNQADVIVPFNSTSR